MKRLFNIWVTNLITNEIEIIHDIGEYYYCDKELASRLLFAKLEKYFNTQTPIKLELVYKTLGN